MSFSNISGKISCLIFLSVFLIASKANSTQITVSSIQDLLRHRIEAGGVPVKISIDQELIYSSIVLPVFYEKRVYRPAWTDTQANFHKAVSLLKIIREVDREGLRPKDYHLEKIEAILSALQGLQKRQKPLNPDQLVDIDLLLTDAFLILGSHLYSGKINPQTVDPQWHVNRRKRDMAQLLETALASNEIENALYSLLPGHKGYARLRQALVHYRQIVDRGGWPALSKGPKLQKGDRSDRIPALRQRLAADGFIENQSMKDGTLFDDALQQALREFQQLNGLETDGILGTQTQQALNISAEQRVRQVIVNMERWRWLPQDWGHRYVLVNIASFNLDVIENEQLVMDMRVIAGRPYRRTPVFSGRMTYLVMNPSWEVPNKIAIKDLLPKIKKDPQFLSQQKIKVFKGWGSNAGEINPDAVDWKAVTESNFKYRFRQAPGPLNALGRIKFMFPNQFDVYLHDTPAKNLFGKSRRDFSSGCIRMEKPVEFAEYLLRNHPAWPPEKIRSSLNDSQPIEQTVQVPEPINIHILYWTVWLGHDSLFHFSPDIYGRDSALDAALQQPRPAASG